MNETAAREVVLVRAIETTDRAREIWSDADRAWASLAAAQVVGAAAPSELFLARRAALAVERLGDRHPAIQHLRRALSWRRWVGIALLLVAFATGVAVDQIGADRWVNILAPPLLALLAWNVFVYATLAVGLFSRRAADQPRASGPLRRLVARLGRNVPRGVSGSALGNPLTAATAAFVTDWSRLAAPLLSMRVARILNLAAATFAVGAILGLYVRGLAVEYRAGWESTFLDAGAVHRLLSFALAPGAALTGIGIPSADHLEAIRVGAAGPSENAAAWIHLYAATVAVVVVVPRLLLAMGAWLAERHYAHHLPLRLDEPYFLRLLREFVNGPALVHAVPYSFEVPKPSVEGLKAVCARVFGVATELTLVPPVRYGAEDAFPPGTLPAAPPALIVALFNLAATPEYENHGAFIATLVAHIVPGTPLVAIVDETSFRNRFAGNTARLDERRAAWRQMLAAHHSVSVVFLSLGEADLPAAEVELNQALERRA